MKKLSFLLVALMLSVAVNSFKEAQGQLAHQEVKLAETTEALHKQEEIRAQKLAVAKKKAEAVKAQRKAKLAKEDAIRKAPVAKAVPRPTGGCEQYRHLVAKYDWDVRTAMAIMQAESTQHGVACNALADNTGLNSDGTNDKGLMQINSVHVPHIIGDNERFTPSANIRAAYAIYKGGGWSAWSAYNNGSYAKYLR